MYERCTGKQKVVMSFGRKLPAREPKACPHASKLPAAAPYSTRTRRPVWNSGTKLLIGDSECLSHIMYRKSPRTTVCGAVQRLWCSTLLGVAVMHVLIVEDELVVREA